MHAHRLFLLQGTFMFSINYMLTYLAETKVSSGLVALAFTSLIYFNMGWMKFAYKKKITLTTISGTLLGTFGISLIFNHELQRFNFNSLTVLGILLSVAATFSASMGNWASYRVNQMKIPVIAGNFWAILYGTLFTLCIGLIKGESFHADLNSEYIISLAYLSLFGTVFAFGAYLTLANRVGSEKAAYTSIVSPVLALILSSFFEDFHWTPAVITGALLCLFGNLLIFKPVQILKV